MHLIKVACKEIFKFKLDTSVERITCLIQKVFCIIQGRLVLSDVPFPSKISFRSFALAQLNFKIGFNLRISCYKNAFLF